MYLRADRWWRSQGHADKVGSTQMPHAQNGRATEAVNKTICAPYFILDVEMELLQVCVPLLMVVILQILLCLYELQSLVISVDDCLSQNVMFQLTTCLHNGIHFFVIGGVFPDSI
jgi:hypothetical protein